ncbi:hypothetical protein PY254_01695 [Rhodanobacter sp. AS-Z3]|uniref:hypothetical protein n=1 Tax=Rhodanobacter sp. AS-Z3 TaxID=3031330 RepID=UPI002478BBB5|nr:hypothetical protein [Rhodanobacter sp. AS-Z3]WEN15415.1 hypothetical protein PY254_01695 [Rhodanobacter sp. AS-Z3]
MPNHWLAPYLQNFLEEGLAKNATASIIRLPAAADIAKRAATTSKISSSRVLTGKESDVEWAAHLGRNVLGRKPETGCKRTIFDSVRR